MDISETLAPSSDQLDAIELVAGPRTFTISGVSRGSEDQPVQVSLADFPRFWRPGKSMRRVLAAAWGTDASQYVGRRVTLFCDPEVTFGRDKTGGTRISHLSHIDKPLTVPLIVKRGQIKPFTVQPLKDVPAPAQQPPAPTGPTPDQVAASTDVAELQAWIEQTANPRARAAIQARIEALTASTDDQFIDAFPNGDDQ